VRRSEPRRSKAFNDVWSDVLVCEEGEVERLHAARYERARIHVLFQFRQFVTQVRRGLAAARRILDQTVLDDSTQLRCKAPLRSATEGGVSLRIDDNTVTLLSPLNGLWPVAIS
jgi:hypothetical protein